MDLGKLVHGFQEITNGFGDIVNGAVREIEQGPVGIVYFFMDAFVLLQFVAVFIFTNFICSLKFLGNFTSCGGYYLFDGILKLLYLIPGTFIFLADLAGLQGSKYEKIFWDSFDYFTFNVFHYSKSVQEKCYNCKRLKISVFAKVISEFMDDMEDPIFGLMFGGIVQFLSGCMEIIQGIMDVIHGIF
jgi:hypothetical protein